MIKPQFELVQNQNTASFFVNEFKTKVFDGPYHYHPEYELTCILNGSGQRLVGSHISNFTDGDMVLLGNQLPHRWKNDQRDYESNPLHAIVIQFSDALLGRDWLLQPEFTKTKALLEKSKCGISFIGETGKKAKSLLIKLTEQSSPFRRMISLLEILNALAESTEFVLLDNFYDSLLQSPKQIERRNKIFTYLSDHYREEISLAAVSNLANMTPNAFCKYFKKMTQKTFFDYLIQLRISYICEQLVNTDKTISEICFNSGFGNLSHFNKTFKAMTQTSPLQYRKRSLLY